MDVLIARHVLKRQVLPLALCVVLGLAGSFLALQRTTKLYASTVTFVLTDSTSGRPVSPLFADQAQVYFTGYASLVRTSAVLAQVFRDAPYPLYDVGATGIPNTIFMRMGVTSDSPEHALALAQAYSREFPRVLATFQPDTSARTGLKVLQPPELDQRVVEPRVRRELAKGGALSLLVGLAVAAAREGVDRRRSGTSRLEERTSWPLLVSLPRQHPRHRAVMLTRPGSGRAEAVRQLRAAVTRETASGAVIAVCSAAREEGRTSIASDLGVALSDNGFNVLLVDAATRRPRMAATFTLPAEPGLTEVLRGQLSLATAVKRSPARQLDVLTAGSDSRRDEQLLAGPALGQLFARASVDYDVILVDTVPLLGSADAAAVLAHAGHALLILREGVTTHEQALAAAEALRVSGTLVLGIVVNASRRAEGTDVPARGLVGSRAR